MCLAHPDCGLPADCAAAFAALPYAVPDWRAERLPGRENRPPPSCRQPPRGASGQHRRRRVLHSLVLRVHPAGAAAVLGAGLDSRHCPITPGNSGNRL